MSTAETNAHIAHSAAGVGRNAAILAAATLFCKLGSLAVMPFILRAFPREEYGAYRAAFAYAGFLGMIAYFGMNPIVVRDIATGERTKGWVVFHCTAIRIVLLAVAAAALSVVGILRGFSGAMWMLAWTAFAAMAFDAVTGAVKASMQAEYRFGRMATVDMVRKASQWGLAIAVIVLGAGVSMLAGSVAIAAAVSMSAALMMGLAREDFAGVRFAPAYARKMLILAAPMGLSAALSLALEGLDTWMLDIMRGKVDVGVYAAAVGFKPDFIAHSVVWAMLPLAFRLGRENPARLASVVRTAGRYLLIVGVAAAIVFVAGGPLLIPVLAGAQYRESIPVFQIMGVSLPLVFVSFLYLHALTAVDRQRVAAVVFAAGVTVNFLMDLLLVPALGPKGAILGTLAAETVIVALSFVCVWRLVGRPFESTDARLLAAVAVSAAVGVVVYWAGVTDLGLTAVLVFAAMLLVLKVVSKADMALVVSAFSGR